MDRLGFITPPFGTATWALTAVLSISLATSPAAPAAETNVLARVGQGTITLAELEGEMNRRARGRPDQYTEPADRRLLLEEMIEFRALAETASHSGYAEDPRIRLLLDRLMVRLYLEDRLEGRLAEIEVTDEEVERLYAAEAESLAVPERRRAALLHIAVPAGASAAKREELAERARLALEETRALPESIGHFGKVAVKYSDDRASRYVGGVIGWLSPGQSYRWEPEVVEQVFALEEPGEIAPLVETGSGLYLIRLVDREEPSIRPLRTLAPGLRNRLLKQKRERQRQEFLDDILADVGVEIDEQLLGTVEPPPAAVKEPPPLPGSEAR